MTWSSQPSLCYQQLDGADGPVMCDHTAIWKEGVECKCQGTGIKRLTLASYPNSVSVTELLLEFSIVELGPCPVNEISTFFVILLSSLVYMLLQQRILE